MLKSICIALKLCSTLSGPAEVIDGDTIKVEGHTVRLHGIDAPELHEASGHIARMVLGMIIFNREVHCKLTGERSYKRYVATCFMGADDIAAVMISNGFALDCKHYSGGKYRLLEPDDARRRLKQKYYCHG